MSDHDDQLPGGDDQAREFLGKTLDNVTIESLIAVGGMGVIYLGREQLTERKVAVKILRPDRQRSDRDREYFVREARALSQIRHPNLVELYHVGTTPDGRHYMVLEFVPGRTLRELVEQEGALEPLRCVRLFRQLLLALEATHAHGILHRDLKPDNLLIETLQRGKERLRLADLGLVKFTRHALPRLTDVGMTVGTPCYMAPEQVRGQELDPRSDLYTTGVLLFEALTTYLPYPRAKDVDELLDHILEATPAQLVRANARFSRLPGLQSLLDSLLAKDPVHRPTSAAKVIEIIDHLLETELSGDVRAALKEHEARYGDDGTTLRAELERSHHQPHHARRAATGLRVEDCAVFTFCAFTRATQEPTAPSPALLRRLRAWLEVGGDIIAAARDGSFATFALHHSDTLQRVLVGLPWLLQRAAAAEDLLLCVGAASGSLRIERDGIPISEGAIRRARALIPRLHPGQAAACARTTARYQLHGTPLLATPPGP